MNRSAIAAARARHVGEIADALGTLVTVGGATFYAHVTTPQPSMNLVTGGFDTNRTIKVRWPSDRCARPAVGATLLLVGDNLSFRVETATSLPGSPLSGGEVIVTATRE